MRLWKVVLLSVCLWSCKTIGRDFNTIHVRDVATGQSKAQIQRWFGEPVQTVTFFPTARGCVERWIYKYAYMEGDLAHARALFVDFDPRGAVCDSSYSETKE